MKIIGMMMSLMIAFNLFTGSINDNRLLKMIEVADQQDILITNWKVYIKKPVSNVSTEAEVSKEISKLVSSDRSYNWETIGHESKHHFNKFGQKITQSNGVNEQATITVYKDGKDYRISLSYEISGNEWSETAWEYVVSTYKDQLDQNSVFYSVYGTKKYDENVDLELEAETILKTFSGDRIEEMNEDQFVSVTAYVKNWDMKIPTKEDKVFNLQFGLRKDPSNGRIEVAIGTPIITSGY